MPEESTLQLTLESNLLTLPVAPLEEDDSRGGDGRLGCDNRVEHSVRAQPERQRQKVSQRNLHKPEAEKIHYGRSYRVSRTVKRLKHHHAVCVPNISVAEDAQAVGGQRHDCGVIREEPHGRFGKEHEENPDGAEKQHVIEARAPYGAFRALGPFCAEVLADERGCGVTQSPGRQDDENQDAYRDGIAGKSIRAKDADDAHEADPARMRDRKLQNARQRNPQQPQQNAKMQTNLAAQDSNAFRAAKQAVELIGDSDASARKSGQRGARYAQLGKWPQSEDQARIEDEVDDVRYPQQAHGNGCVSRAAEDGVVQEEHHDRSAAAKSDARIA